MKIGIIGSMQFTEKMVEIRDKLKEMGHDTFITELHYDFIGKTIAEKEQIKKDQMDGNIDTIREFWDLMQGADAVLVLNLEKNNIENYIGANTLMEIGFAHVLNQKIFFYNPMPDMPYCREELEAVHPIVINGDLDLIK
ncbi:hypothetical protein GF366_02070 [Candidatus Peregrinibacteria bacterium]|nr:hypothetical protein [Candidatus Peregrinibacteria bacterium]